MASASTTTKRPGTLNDRSFPTLKLKASYCSSAARFESHTSDIFQPYFVCKVTNKREQYKINTCFCFYCRAKVLSIKSKLINYFEMITRLL
jgi:hypothetical protein